MQPVMGIDVSKGYADFIVIDQNKKVVELNFQLDDSNNGHAQLYELINSLFEKYPDLALTAAVESTGGYENNWLNAFSVSVMPMLNALPNIFIFVILLV